MRAEGRGQQQREGSHLDVSLPWGAQVAVVGEGGQKTYMTEVGGE